MQLGNSEVTLEEQETWQKIVMPAEKSQGWFLFYTVAMLIWVVMLLVVVVGLFRPFLPDAPWTSNLTWRVVLFVWLAVWIWFARRSLWRHWQYYAANREILFINDQEFIVRRPVSLLGVTDVYDMSHIQSVYFHEEQQSPTFDYGFQPIHFGRGLSPKVGKELISLLNHRYFAQTDDETF